MCSGTQVSDKDFLFLTEMLMRQLLKLDGIDAQGEGRIQRKLEVSFLMLLLRRRVFWTFHKIVKLSYCVKFQVRRVQGLVETLDDLKVKNSNPNPNPNPNPISNVPEASATKATQEWEVFE